MSTAFIPQGLLVRYLESLPNKKQELSTLFGAYLSQHNEDTAADLRSALHRLAGSTAMYGFDSLSETIRSALRIIDNALESGSLPSAQLLTQAQAIIDQSWGQAAQEARQALTE